MIFFADANISTQAAKLLAIFDRENQVRHHNESFEEGTDDTVWMQGIAGWDPKPAVVCGDGRILTRPAEKAALRQADLTFFVLAKGWTNEAWAAFAWKIITKSGPQSSKQLATLGGRRSSRSPLMAKWKRSGPQPS